MRGGRRRGARFKQADRLVALSVLGAVGLTWLVLVGFDAFTVFVGHLGDIGHGQYTLSTAVIEVLLTFPRRAYELFGYAALIGGLLGLGRLAGSSELTALRAAGMSKLRICASVVVVLAALTLLVVVVGETIGPAGEQKSQSLELAAKSREVALARGGALWARDRGAVINANEARSRTTPSGRVLELSDVRVFEFDPDGRLTTLSQAQSATYRHGVWTMKQVRRTEFGIDSARSTEEAERQWPSGLDPRMLSLSIVQPQYMALRDLSHNIALLERNGQDASAFRESYWARVFHPLSILVLAFCALPFAFGSLRSGGLSKRLFIGIVLAIGFYFLQHAIVNFGAVYNVHPAIANLVPPLLLAVGAIAYFRRHA
ncbi:MAG: LPS export ABC transporter permease LptG [Rhodanobacteraceae bacterium]